MATLKENVKSLEDNIITISGPALAISGIIAGVDLLSANIIKTYFPLVGDVLGVVWAICLMLTLDFQVLTLGVKSRRIYQSDRPGWQKIGEMALAMLVALAIGYVSVQMGVIFARTLGTQMSIDQAEALLGINPTALYYERSAMVMLLIFMSGWLRDSDEPGQAIAQPVVQAATVKQEDIDAALKALAEVQSLRDQLAQLQAVQVQPIAPIAQQIPAQSATLAILDEALDEVVTMATEKPERGLVNPLVKQSYEPQITALYKANPAIEPAEVVQLTGCSFPTATKWLSRLQPTK